MGHQPLSLAAPLAHLNGAGFAPIAVDASLDKVDDRDIRAAQVVAFAVPMHTATRLAIPLAKRVRRLNPTAHITFFGLYAWLNRDYLLEDLADSVIAGEFEGPLVELVRTVEQGGSVHDLAGISTREHSATPSLVRLEPLLPVRDTLPGLCNYAQFRSAEGLVPAAYVEATRGCLHRCTHCPITPVYGGRFVAMPREIVLADITAQVEAGARHVTFGDPDFLNGPTHARRIIASLHEAHPDVTWDATIKIEHILEHASLFADFATQGCAFVVSAVESFSDVVLDRLEKGHTATDIATAAQILRDAGIVMRPTFLPFTPWTTMEAFIELLDRVDDLALAPQVDPVQYSIRLLVPPHSALLDQPDADRWFGPLDPVALSHGWQHPDPRMDALQRDVATIAEDAAASDEAILTTFLRIRSAAHRAAAIDDERRDFTYDPVMEVVPGLTEAWFC